MPNKNHTESVKYPGVRRRWPRSVIQQGDVQTQTGPPWEPQCIWGFQCSRKMPFHEACRAWLPPALPLPSWSRIVCDRRACPSGQIEPLRGVQARRSGRSNSVASIGSSVAQCPCTRVALSSWARCRERAAHARLACWWRVERGADDGGEKKSVMLPLVRGPGCGAECEALRAWRRRPRRRQKWPLPPVIHPPSLSRPLCSLAPRHKAGRGETQPGTTRHPSLGWHGTLYIASCL